MVASRIREKIQGNGLGARAFRGSALTFVGFGGGMLLRLISNLILTRLLFPEAFGLMALVQVFMIGLQMFSDTGINTSIMQNKRGDDPDFLNTAWTVDLIRGVLLWLVILGLAGPVAGFYDQPMLAELLPVAGLVAVLQPLRSTKIITASRNLLLGRVTFVELSSQFLGILVMIGLAYLYKSVWALVIGTLAAALARSVMTYFVFEGPNNRFHIDRRSFWELFHFGKFIFVASIAGFLVNYADRGILGKFISVGDLGIYNIAYFLASVPIILTRVLGDRVMLPIYRETPPKEADGNWRKARKARLALTSFLLLMGFSIALLGEFIIALLYEQEYAFAGPILVLLSLTYMPTIIINAYSALVLASGDSRLFTAYTIILAIVQTSLLLWGVSNFGIIGAILAPGVSSFLVYPVIAWMARRHGGYDLVLDLGFFAVLTLGALAVLLVHDTAWFEILNRGS